MNHETAERLLRGESPEVTGPAAAEQAERLAKALDALAADATVAGAELPGEEAALAAFRKARETAPAERPARARAPRRPRWARPVRLALAGALVAGTVGGVAVAAGTGVLPQPFGDHRPGPAASVSAAASSENPPGSPALDSAQGGKSGVPTPGVTPAVPGGSAHDTADGPGRDGKDGSGGKNGKGDKGGDDGGGDLAAPSGRTGTWWKAVALSCQDIRDGRTLGSDRRRTLEGAAGGSAQVAKYCAYVLELTAGLGGTGKDGDGKGDGGEGDGWGDEQGHGGHGDHGGHHGRGHGGRPRGGSIDQGGGDGGSTVLPTPTSLANLL
ncbi:hypothetical protein [Streptomyces sp. NPDC086787]|uniref:hypothetical protein n=1 Tax=Streptomyces sp. NPDC086787 TaxID=3365759 RepID=UPI003825B05C